MKKYECSFCSSEVSSERIRSFCPGNINTNQHDICEFCHTSVPPWVLRDAVPYQKKPDDVLMNVWVAAARVANYIKQGVTLENVCGDL